MNQGREKTDNGTITLIVNQIQRIMPSSFEFKQRTNRAIEMLLTLTAKVITKSLNNKVEMDK
jgi:hypothetical protein